MKIKEINQTANIAWSPAAQYPVYLATGTAAQQVDASFSTTSKIDLFSLDLENPGLDMTLKASIPTKQRYIIEFQLKFLLPLVSNSKSCNCTGFTNWCGAHKG